MSELPARLRTPGPMPVVTFVLAGFMVLLALLAWQLGRGRDPALGAEVAAEPAPRRVVIHRKIIRRVIVDVPPGAGSSAAAPQAVAPQAAASPSRAAAPVSAPAPPAAAPAPAPAPPVSTRTS